MTDTTQITQIRAAAAESRHPAFRRQAEAGGAWPRRDRGRLRRRRLRPLLLDHRPISRLDRRRLCRRAFGNDQPQGLGLHLRRSGQRQPARQGGPGHRPHRPAGLPDGARPGARKCRGGAGDDRDADPTDRAATPRRSSKPVSRSRRIRRRSSIRSRTSSATRIWNAPATARCSAPSRLSPTSSRNRRSWTATKRGSPAPRSRSPCFRRSSSRRARPWRSNRRTSIRPSSISATRRSQRRSTARWACARCRSASMFSRARS